MKWFEDLPTPPEEIFLPAKAAQPKGTIVFIHGFTSSYYLHQPFVKNFDLTEYNYFALNLPDHEFSDWHSQPKHWFSFQKYLDKILSAIQTRQLDNIILIGHSMGGGLAAFVANQIPEKIQKVILVSPVNHALFQSKLGLRYLFDTLLNIDKELYAIEFGNFPTNVYLDFEIRRFIYLKYKFLSIGTKLLDLTYLNKLQKQYKQFRWPTLVITGSKDPVVPANGAWQFFHRLKNPNFVFTTIIGSFHVPFVDNTEEYCRLIAAFLATERN